MTKKTTTSDPREPATGARHRTDVRNGGRLREMPPFGEPDAPYPPVPGDGAAAGAGASREDDPLGLFMPPDGAARD